MTTPQPDVLFSVTLYLDGTLQIGGKTLVTGTLADVLRLIADSLESGATVLRESGN
jgi:hypothetical protein